MEHLLVDRRSQDESLAFLISVCLNLWWIIAAFSNSVLLYILGSLRKPPKSHKIVLKCSELLVLQGEIPAFL